MQARPRVGAGLHRARGEAGASLPKFAVHDVERVLRCGDFEHGFLRLNCHRCDECATGPVLVQVEVELSIVHRCNETVHGSSAAWQ
jgi:hypothetical protein